MNKEFDKFVEIASEIDEAVQSKLFGKDCFKVNKKAFICFFKNEMVFKLNGDFHIEALSLDGATLFDPSGKKRPMKEWVQLPFDYVDKWDYFALQAFNYVKN